MTFDLTVSTQITLPVVIAKNFVPIPSSESRSEFTRSADIKSLKKAELFQNYCVLMLPQNNDVKAGLIDGHYTRAVVAKVILNSSIANSIASHVQAFASEYSRTHGGVNITIEEYERICKG